MRIARYLALLLLVNSLLFAQSDAKLTLPDSTKLIVLKQERASYPRAAREKGIQGQVMVRFTITESGEVEKVEAVSGDPILLESALKAAKLWRFAPYFKSGKAVKVTTNLPFDFAFNGKVYDFPAKAGETESANQEQKAAADPNASPMPDRVRVSQGVAQGLLKHQVAPVYPENARMARIEGQVVMSAIIARDGYLKNLQVISGHPMLIEAALGAVQQWRYKPYMLMGQPVEVETQILVNFRLQ